ncbi:anaerobic sulfite reductase subunit A [Eubacterium pyruvativorans]|uniref:Anaerobic sulfite reductase subunit A n=2 Tax=Eubacterium TaxID=1730 RepID=A0A1I7HI90_9FIRM|nr:anaerobic sulfite reductase subunit AsrA [Eubacterium pyruvativorans]MCI5746884.1 anaerobic sulfite reductase subunit AsrA [Eubacterium pyruvativorans]SFO26643.1 anaerobic sulfite reductase subunit A [Eubacterium pyruvativorans]SFU60186.1 anaerobic sulfite reductase subunit A [Eubacterium pyruvativorans]
MGYVLSRDGFDRVLRGMREDYRIFAPVLKEGEGRFKDTDVVRYDFVDSLDEIELDLRSDYSFRDILTPLSETMFYFTEDQIREANIDTRPVIVLMRSCDINAVKRLDQMYLGNGENDDYYYERRRELVKFALIGCGKACDNSFCVSMGSNRTDDYVFSMDVIDGEVHCDVKEESLQPLFEENAGTKQDVTPQFVTEAEFRVTRPEEVPLSLFEDSFWDEYTKRCINCGRCNLVCPTCTCFTIQDLFYTDNGKVGERRRVCASCMIDGYTDVAGGLKLRQTNGQRMRFKALHKVYDFRKRFGYDMCVGCGRCDTVCPEYISFSNCINKMNDRVKELEVNDDAR